MTYDMTHVGGGRVPTGVEERPAIRGAVPRRRLRPGLREGAVLRHPVRISHRKGNFTQPKIAFDFSTIVIHWKMLCLSHSPMSRAVDP